MKTNEKVWEGPKMIYGELRASVNEKWKKKKQFLFLNHKNIEKTNEPKSLYNSIL